MSSSRNSTENVNRDQSGMAGLSTGIMRDVQPELTLALRRNTVLSDPEVKAVASDSAWVPAIGLKVAQCMSVEIGRLNQLSVDQHNVRVISL